MKIAQFRCRAFGFVFSSLLAAAWGQTPNITAVDNGGTFAGGPIAPGEVIAIYGTNLSTSTVSSCAIGGVEPTTCGSIQVLLNGSAIPLIYVSAVQINAVVPFELTGATASMQVNSPGGLSSAVALNVVPASPAIILQSAGVGAFYTATNQLITSASPATAGQVVVGYAYGLGITNPAPVDGNTAACSPNCLTAATVSVAVGGVPAVVAFAGLIEQIGLYQVNFTIPAGLLGNQPVVFTLDGIPSPSATIPLAAGSPGAVSVSSPSNLGTFPLGEVQVGLAATGGNGSYQWALVSGTLPPGLSLRGDLPSYVTSGGPTGLIGIATTPGTYDFTLSVTSGVNATQQAFSMKITALTLMDSNDYANHGGLLPDGFVGVPYYGSGYQLVATENGTEVAVTCSGTPPPGMALSPSGLLSGPPTTSGKNAFTVTCTNGTDSVSQTLAIYAYAVQVTSPGELPNATQNASYSYALSASGGIGPYTYSVSGLPPGLTPSAAGVISGTPTGTPGKYAISVTATDSQSHSYTKSLAIDIVVSPELLQQILQYGDLWDCTIGMACSRGIGVYSGGTAPFTWNVTGLPPGMGFRYGNGNTLYTINAGDVELWGTPTALGTYNVTVTATDANSVPVTQIYPLKVSALLVDTSLPGGTVGTPYANTFRIVGGVPPYTVTQAPSRATPVGLPDGLQVSGIAVTGTPLEGGQFYPLFLATDSAGTANTLTFSQSTYFNGVAGSSTTVAYYGPQYVTAGVAFSLQLAACCAANYTWTQPSGTPPTGIGLSSSGLLSGISSTEGTYTFLVKATQTGTPANYGTRQITLVVTPLAQTSAFAMPNGFINTSYNQTLTVSGASGSLTWSLTPGDLLPPGLSLNASTGAITGTPTDVGAYYFSVYIVDTAGDTRVGFYNLDIYSSTIAPPVTLINSANLGTFSIGEIQIGLKASGGNNTYTWSLVSGTLPTGLSLRTDTPSDFAANASAGLIGVATAPGTYIFTLKVASGNQSATQTFTMKISALVGMENWYFRLPEAYVNQSPEYSYALTALNPAGSVTFTPVSGLPPGISLSSSGVLSGTPTTAGVYNVNFTIFDGTDTVSEWVSINVSVVQVTSPGLLPNATQNAAYSYTVAASGGTGPYTFTLSGNLPAGLTINSAGQITGTATGGAGRTNFTVTATDSASHSDAKNVAIITVGVPPALPSLSPYGYTDTLDDCTVGITCTRAIGNYSGGTGPFSYTVTGLPAGMTYTTITGASRFGTGGDLEIWGTAKTAGQYPLTVTLTDAANVTATQAFTLSVSNLYIDGADYLPSGTIGVAYSKLLRVLGGTPGSGNTVYGTSINMLLAPPNYVTLPAGLSLSGMTVSGTPAENGFFVPQFKFTDSGSNTLNISEGFSIGDGSSSVTITQTYTQTFDLGTITAGSTYSNQLSASGASSYTWSQDGGTWPPGITISSAGLLNGTATTAGTYLFLVKAASSSNSANFGVRQFQLIVTPLNITTTGLPDGILTVAYSQTLAATGATGAVTWSVAAGSYPLPPGLNLSTAGVISGTPTQTGNYNFYVLATDSATPTAHIYFKSFDILVYTTAGPPLFLSAGSNLGTFGSGSEYVFNLNPTGGRPPYTISLASGSSLPVGCAFVSGDALLANGQGSYDLYCVSQVPGTYNFTVMVTDSASLPNVYSKTFTIVFAPFTPFTSTALANGSIGTPYSQSLLAWDNSATPTVSLASGSTFPPGLGITNNVLMGTPTGAGTYSFTLAFTDSSGVVLDATFSLVISTITITDPQVLTQQAIINLPFTYTFTATGGGSSKTWSATGLPSGFTMSSTGTLSGTTTVAFRDRISVTVTDGSSPLTEAFAFAGRANSPTVLDYQQAGTVLPDALLGQSYVYGFSPDGGVQPYTWSVASGSQLPPGLKLYQGTSVLSSNATPGNTQLDGEASVAGHYTFTLILGDSAGATAQRTFSLNVTPMGILPGSLMTPITGQAYNQQLPVVGGTAPYTFTYSPSGINTETFPAGLTASSSGLISGTPTTTGNFGFTTTVTDSSNPPNTYTVTYSYTATNANGLRVTTGIPYDNSAGKASGGLSLATSGSSTYTWSVTSGAASLPPGLALNGSNIQGVLTTPGTYKFTVQATDNSNSSNVAVRTFTWVVSPMQIISEIPLYLPPARQNSAYSYQLKVAGGTAPYQFAESNLYPLPPGITLSPSGLLSGTPTTTGQFTLYHVVTDNTGIAMKSPGVYLNVVAPAAANPLWVDPSSGGHNVTVGQPYFTYLDQVLEGSGTPPYTWTLASNSSLPPGYAILPGTGNVTSLLGGWATTVGTYPVNLVVTDSASQTAYYSVPYTVFASLFASDTPLPDGVVGTGYSWPVGVSGGTAPLTTTSDEDMPPGLTLSSSGVLSGTPQYPGYFVINYGVADSSTPTKVSYGRTNYIVIDQSGQAPGINMSPSLVQLTYFANGTAPAATPIAISTTSGNLPFSASIAGIPGATLSISTGTTPATVNILLNTTGVAAGTYTGALALNAPGAVFPANWIPVELTVVPPPMLSIVSQHAGDFNEGETGATYLVTVSNASGQSATSGMVTVTETVPSGVTLIAMSGTGWTCPSSPGNTCMRSDPLSGGMSYLPITVTVNVAAGTLGTVTNKVSVSGGGSATANASDPTTVLTYSLCDLNQDGSTSVLDVQSVINQALGKASPANDLNLDGEVNAVDIQIVINAVLKLGCSARMAF